MGETAEARAAADLVIAFALWLAGSVCAHSVLTLLGLVQETASPDTARKPNPSQLRNVLQSLELGMSLTDNADPGLLVLSDFHPYFLLFRESCCDSQRDAYLTTAEISRQEQEV